MGTREKRQRTTTSGASNVTALALAACLLAFSTSARAQADNDVAAEALFREAGKLVTEQKYELACEKFAASERLAPAAGTLLNLAHCYEKIGKTASAWLAYCEAAAVAKQAGQSPREKAARKGAELLEPTLARLTVTAPSSANADLHITRDGVPLPSDIWGSSLPVDPGDHVIAAAASGHKSWTTTVTVAARNSVSVTVPELESSPDPASTSATPGLAVSTPAVSNARETAPLADHPAAPATNFWNTQRILALVSGGVGVAGGIVSAVEFAAFTDKRDQAQTVCPGMCQEPHYSQADQLRNEAVTARTVSIVGVVVAGVGLITGTVLWFTAPSASTSEHVAFSATVASGRWSLGVEGPL